jgi:hypothetical protein
MSFRFRKSIKIAPGVRLNISKRGLGASIGGKGVTHSVGPSGQRTSVGLPESGIGYSVRHGSKNPVDDQDSQPAVQSHGLNPLTIVFIAVIAGAALLRLTH